MLFLKFSLGADRYVLDVAEIDAVLPLMSAKALPGAPAGIVGAINYGGQPIPLIDLSLLALGRPAASVISTRIILVHYAGQAGENHRLGLIAEHVIETITRDETDFTLSGVEAGMPAYLGPVATDEQGIIQRVRAERLLPDEVRAILFRRLERGA